MPCDPFPSDDPLLTSRRRAVSGDSDSDPAETPSATVPDLSGVHRFPYQRRGSRDSDSDSGSRADPAATLGPGSDKSGSVTPCDGLQRLFAAPEESVALAAGILNEVRTGWSHCCACCSVAVPAVWVLCFSGGGDL